MRLIRLAMACAATVLSLTSTALAESQGVFEIKLNSFKNDYQRDSHGRCCRGYRTKSGQCSESCATRFRVCLTHYQSQIDYNLNRQCTFGEYKLPSLNTVHIPLEIKWPGSFSLIIEAWHSDNKTEEVLISRVAKLERLEAGSNWVRSQHIENLGRQRLDFEYRMVCSAHYYGKDCNTLCRPRDDKYGHYQCDSQGVKQCLPGWQKDLNDDYCTKPVCSTGCHSEHGECSKPGECKCRPGWTGVNCDECKRYPGCKHGSCSKPWECQCNSGWGGLFCDQDLNYCTNNAPCMNGATCLNTGQGSYTCSCPPGYTGKNCQHRVENECSHQPCLNGGTCQGSGLNDYKCICPIGYGGVHCDRVARDCSDSPCQNGARCLPTSYRGGSRGVGYTCQCAPGYQGFNCDVKIDHCSTTPCENGGTCIHERDGSYKCACRDGFAGNTCQVNKDDCALNPCQNGGSCIDLVDDYTCTCPAGFGGTNCEENINDCAHNPCANGGTCHDEIGGFKCTCPSGFTGKDCSQEVNECDSSPCMNNGFCINRVDDFECKCLPGYSGKACNVLPDGTVLSLNGEDGSRTALIAAFSTIVPLLVVVAVAVLMCNKHREARDRRRADEAATKENELNAVASVNKGKSLDDHMIKNDFTPQPPRNLNLADEGAFNAKDSAYKQVMAISGKKALNTDRTYCDKLLETASASSSASTASTSMRHSALYQPASNRSFNDCASTVSTSSSESSRSYYSKKASDLPTAASIQNDVAKSKKPSRQGYVPAPASQPSQFQIGMERASNYACTQDEDLFATEV